MSPRITLRRGAAALAVLAAITLVGCGKTGPQALGTLEYDRITVPAPEGERITGIHVREGQQVGEGTALLTLERTRGDARLMASLAEASQRREALLELQAGPRREDIAQARASLAATRAQARDARARYQRLAPLGSQQLVSAADVDAARAAAESAEAQVRAGQAALDELLNGARPEQLAQASAALQAAQARFRAEEATAEKLSVVAPRAGRVDSLPYRSGDQAPIGAPLAVLLVGDAPYARIHVPQPIREQVDVGDRVRVRLEGSGRTFAGEVRMIRSEPAFTPYYALTGDDVARLGYLAEVQLEPAAGGLPAGLPVLVEFNAGDRAQ
ncbi:HlyD family efflux transporter periplasmic adaptor subunit [Luteimonas sp. MJ293]|uniref:HlyD family secretion protein n=1 Tax=Luteimonas sp. MJ146 TaxID=3129240 RepID=UPI0031B9B6DC